MDQGSYSRPDGRGQPSLYVPDNVYDTDDTLADL